MSSYPPDIGIVALEIYFPQTCVNQEQLEIHDGASKGKYTIGLGQTNMAFVGDREDISSICLTAVSNLMKKYNIPYSSVGRLEVGTESITDKSKSVKSVLMKLFQEQGNTDIEGIDNLNACYGGTAALYNAVNWIESSSWDGRYAIVVAGDIAVYSAGPARPTGGCGAIAVLIGKNAPLIIELNCKSAHFENAFDFYKPIMNSEYPIVDGHFSVECYLKSLDICYSRFKDKWKKKYNTPFNLGTIDYVAFHTPFCKLIQKAFARLHFHDFLENPEKHEFSSVQQFKNATLETSLGNRELEQAFVTLSSELFKKKTSPSLYLAREIGNIYCGSLYAALLSLVSTQPSLVGKRILMFSYGSGLASSMYTVRIASSVENIAKSVDLKSRLETRTQISPKEFEESLNKREQAYGVSNYLPSDTLKNTILPGTYVLDRIDEKYRRFYNLISDANRKS